MLSHDSGTSLLAEGGSIVTRLSEDKQDWSAVIEKMSTANSVCARGSNPVSAMTVEGNTQMRATWRAVFSPRKFPCVRPEPVLVSHRLSWSTQREETQLTKRACLSVFLFLVCSVVLSMVRTQQVTVASEELTLTLKGSLLSAAKTKVR